MLKSINLLCPGEDDLGILTALMAENEGRGEEQEQRQQADDFDDLFDNDDEDEEGRDVEPEDELTELFGDVDDIRKEDQVAQENKSEASESLNRSQEELQGIYLRPFSWDIP